MQNEIQLYIYMRKKNRQRRTNIQAVVTLKPCILIEVIGYVITSVAVRPILIVNYVEFPCMYTQTFSFYITQTK